MRSEHAAQTRTIKELTMNNSTTHDDKRHDTEREPQTDEPSTKNRTDDAPAPFAPDSDDDSPLGDTDEHSDA
jgi:hypothetical protein